MGAEDWRGRGCYVAGTIVVRPGERPTHDDPEGGRRWHYRDAATGKRLDPPAFLYDFDGGGFGGECDNWIYPDSRGDHTRTGVEARIEEELRRQGVIIVQAFGACAFTPAGAGPSPTPPRPA